MEHAYCPTKSYYSLKGAHDSEYFLYQSLRVELKEDSKREEASNLKLSILYTGYSIDNDIKKTNKSPIKYSIKTYDIELISNMRIYVIQETTKIE